MDLREIIARLDGTGYSIERNHFLVSRRMKLQILGSGTSTGVPMPGCRCAVCRSSNPRNRRLRTSAVVRAGAANIMIDTSPDFRSQVLAHEVDRVDAVIYTHAHADHIMGMDDLRSFNFVQHAPIPCYGSVETLRDIRRTFAYIFGSPKDYEGGMLPQLTLHEFKDYERIAVAGIEFQTFKLWHGKMPVTGYRFGDIAYATDCKEIPEETKAILRRVPHLVIDALRYDPHKTHLTIPESLALIEDLKPERAYLIHTAHSVDYDEVNPKLPSGVELAYDGMVIG